MKVRFTPQWAEKIAHEYVERFCICFLIPDGLYSIFEFNDRQYHIIFISAVQQGDTKKEDNQVATCIHEIIHVFHALWGLPHDERVIEQKTKRFCKQHGEFARSLLDAILVSSKCEGKNGIDNPFDRSEGIGIVAERIKRELSGRS